MLNWDRPEEIRERLQAGARGIEADEALKARILAGRNRKKVSSYYIPAVAAAALVLVLGLAVLLSPQRSGPVPVQNLQAGGEVTVAADTGSAPQVQLLMDTEETAAMLSHDDRSYAEIGRAPAELAELPLGTGVLVRDGEETQAELFSVKDVPAKTAVLARQGENVLLMQRTSGAFAVAGDRFEDVFGVRGLVEEISLNGKSVEGAEAVTLTGMLLDNARLDQAEAFPGEDRVDFCLKNGLVLTLTASGDQVMGCGTWNAEQFLFALREAVR